MCVIVKRDPNVVIPFERLQGACQRNQDGYGVAILDRGKVEVHRGYDPKGNDPEVLARILEEAKELPLWFHLRYMTRGKESLDNTHPFKLLDKDNYGTDLYFMHNGTLTGWGNADVSDSREFAEHVLGPLLRTTSLAVDIDELLTQEFLLPILKSFADYSSVFTLFDANGNELIVNKTRGVQFPGYWASNSYSMDPIVPPKKATSNVSYLPPANKAAEAPKEVTPSQGSFLPDRKLPEFLSLFKLGREDFYKLDRETIVELVNKYPIVAVTLLVSMQYQLWMLDPEKGNTQALAA